MANTKLFGTSAKTPSATATNNAGGQAYSMTAKNELAQYAVTSCFNSTFYVTDEKSLERVQELVGQVDSAFLAKLCLYASSRAHMKDTPLYILSVLHGRGETEIVRSLFSRVVTNFKKLSVFTRFVRSGVGGRKSFGTALKNEVKAFLTKKTPMQVFNGDVGLSNPSIGDVIKMVHPKADSAEKNAVFGYLAGKPYDFDSLPTDLKRFELMKRDIRDFKELPDVPFRALTNLNLGTDDWKDIARRMPWGTLRQNLNMLQTKGVFSDDSFVSEIAAKLADGDSVRNALAFPYQLLTTYQNVDGIPMKLKLALQDAMEVATENVPTLRGKVVVAVDVSGSMRSPVTGYGGTCTKTRCVDVAALFACSLLRKNPEVEVVAFDWNDGLYDPQFNPRDSVLTNAERLARFGGGGTDCSIPFRYLNQQQAKVDTLIMFSDNESWSHNGGRLGSSTEWLALKRRNKNAKLVCIDLQPYGTIQVPDSKDVLNIGGFSDSVFDAIDVFVSNKENVDFTKIVENAVL